MGRQGPNLLERLQRSIALLQCVKQAILPLCCLDVGEHLQRIGADLIESISAVLITLSSHP